LINEFNNVKDDKERERDDKEDLIKTAINIMGQCLASVNVMDRKIGLRENNMLCMVEACMESLEKVDKRVDEIMRQITDKQNNIMASHIQC
jgi:predicted translin family RNA/ssDNA-binding protein